MKKWACIKIWVCLFVSSKVICFSPFPISCSSPLATKHTLDAQVMCPSPYTFGWIASKSHASLPTLWMNGPPSHMLLLHTLDEWPPSHMLFPPHFWMNGLQVICFFPTLWMNGLQVTCFSSTLLDESFTKSLASPPHFWMNRSQSHMLLLHSLDEWATKSHAFPPHFGWMGHQVTCFFPTLWMNGSL